MSDEPEHNLDKPLRALGAKRRQEAGADLSLHPANRRMLQDEVRRQYGQSRPASAKPSWLTNWRPWWPRWAMALGIFTVLGAIVIVWQMNLQQPQEMELAQATPERQERRKATTPSTEANATLPRQLNLSLTDDQDKEVSGEASGHANFAPVTAEKKKADDLSAPKKEAAKRVITTERTQTPGTIPLAPAAAEAPPQRDAALPAVTTAPTRSIVLADSIVQPRSNGVRFRKYSTTSSAVPSNLEEPILAQFELTQDASVIRIVDADGSVYEGTIQSLSQPAEEPAGAASADPSQQSQLGVSTTTLSKPMLAPGGSSSTNSNMVQFLVTGTNRTTQQRIELSGQLQTNQMSLSLGRVTTAEPADLSEDKSVPSTRLPIVLLQGELRVGTNGPVLLRANQIVP